MTNYIPFLKLKVNEIGALKALSLDIKQNITPFFDIPKKDYLSADDFKESIEKAVTSATKNLKDIPAFFLDNYDIEDSLIVDGKNNYGFVINSFSGFNFIPVVGLDRSDERNNLVFERKQQGIIKSDWIAIRLVEEDFENFELVQNEIENLVDMAETIFQNWIFIFDNRVCLHVESTSRASLICGFMENCRKYFGVEHFIVTGSSIPASIRDILEVQTSLDHERVELAIYQEICKLDGSEQIWLGDYTIISPLYSDLEIPVEAMQNVIAPKIIYTHDNVHYVARGSALRTHPRGNKQYNDIANNLIKMAFFRGKIYSFGDSYLDEKGNYQGTSVTPSSILKPTINTHITYMYRDFVI